MRRYYRHGLFITSYPTCSTSLAILTILFCCYPLLNFSPLPGKIPTKVILPYNSQHVTNYSYVKDVIDDKESDNDDHRLNNNNKIGKLHTDAEQNNNFSSSSLPIPSHSWAKVQPPYMYVQQVILRSIVLPWEKELVLTDAFRGPLFEVFKLLEIINNHETNVTLSNLCLHVDSIKRPQKDVYFPEYNCLVLSPANFWRQNIHNFNKDTSLLSTIFQQHNNQKSKVSTAEMLLGVPILDSGLKRYPLQNRSRIIQYAITLIMKERNQEFISSLQKKLHKIYPLHQEQSNELTDNYISNSSVTFIYYPGEFNMIELVPLSIALTVLFIYMYFSIRKVEMIRSRFIVSLSAVVTVLGSLVMSVGFCFFFGLSIWVQSSMGVYPYLLLLVGLENCLVLTKSVMTTENNLDVKIRVAQGLMKEGWAITKNLMTEITILTAGLVLTFLPFLQEFCIFAIVGLVSDYFLQMFLFSTALGLNIKRVEVEMEVKKLPKMFDYSSWHNRKELIMKYDARSLNRSKSHPSQLSDLEHKEISNAKSTEKKIPKRLRIVNFWARTRFFQRGFMIWMVLWISNIIYTSGIIENIFMIDMNNIITSDSSTITPSERTSESINNYESMVKNLSNIMMDYYTKNVQWNKRMDENTEHNVTDKIQKLKHPHYEMSNKLSSFHWASILKQYNITMSGHYVTILPAIKISHVVPMEVALKVRNPNETPPSSSKWNALTSALDPLDLNDADAEDDLPFDLDDHPLFPKTPMEIMLTAILCLVSVFVITYTMIVMYRCICSRNYAEWRSSHWDDTEIIETKTEQVLEGFPIRVKGHKHNIECVVSDGNLIASSCLQNIIKIWSSTNGELVAEINRISYFEQLQQYYLEKKSPSVSEESLIMEQQSTQMENVAQIKTTPQQQPQNDSKANQLRLRSNLNFDFSSQRVKSCDGDFDSQNEFKRSYEKYFEIIPARTKSFDYDTQSSSDTISYSPTSPLTNNTKFNNYISLNNNLNRVNSSSSDNVNGLNSPQYKSSPIWTLDFTDNLIVIGCACGRLEFWEATTGTLRTIFETDKTHGDGVTHVKLSSDKVVAARLSGRIDFYRLETYTQGRHIDWNFTSAYRRTHIRTGSAGSLSSFNQHQQQQNNRYVPRNSLNLSSPLSTTLSSSQNQSSASISYSPTQEELRCILELQHPGHTQPITSLDMLGNVLFTGSQDHTLKVFHTDSNTLMYTLHGHCSPITTLLIDHFQAGTGCSGSQNGILCLWDVVTGACLYNLQAHEECLVSITSAPSYIITLGLDERIRVWERFQGHLLNTINLHHAHSNSIVMLTPSLLITAKPGALLVSDVKDGHVKHEVKLDRSEMSQQITPKMLIPSFGQIICDFGHELRVVRFPLHDKNE
ncbi:hypothetical protein ACKWTF_005397 [Chironomus riparius]